MRSYTFSVWRNSRERLDKYLIRLFPTLSRNFVQQLIQDKRVLVNHKAVSAHAVPKQKEVIQITIPSLTQTGIVPSDIPLEVLYEDEQVVVINKQAGLVVHPSDSGGHVSDSLVNALLYHYPKTFSISGSVRPGIVHRLDKDTSGVLVVAKNDRAMKFLTRQWQDRKVLKEYTALLSGHLQPGKGAIEAPLGRSSTDRKKMGVRPGKEGRYAFTQYEVEKYLDAYSLVKVTILTGRTHQIRAHFQAIGFPVVGDRTYGNPKVNTDFEQTYGLTRQFLHAQKLGFHLPAAKKRLEITAPLPKDLQNVLTALANPPGSER